MVSMWPQRGTMTSCAPGHQGGNLVRALGRRELVGVAAHHQRGAAQPRQVQACIGAGHDGAVLADQLLGTCAQHHIAHHRVNVGRHGGQLGVPDHRIGGQAGKKNKLGHEKQFCGKTGVY
jgi:hypothetical protein